MLKKLYSYMNRNNTSLGKNKTVPNRVNIEWWNSRPNVGDALSPVIVEWMLEQRGIQADKYVQSTKHLLALGSIVGTKNFDATVWGSGIHTFDNVGRLAKYHRIIKYDIRALRGPITQDALRTCKYNVDGIPLGDPAVLMPLIYQPPSVEKEYDLCVIDHYYNHSDISGDRTIVLPAGTNDYQYFINTIIASEKVISSSLHGIILAESYGIPAVFLCNGVEHQMMKYYDWYYSTGRYEVKVAKNIEEGIHMEPMPLPDLNEIRSGLIQSFPYDLWE